MEGKRSHRKVTKWALRTQQSVDFPRHYILNFAVAAEDFRKVLQKFQFYACASITILLPPPDRSNQHPGATEPDEIRKRLKCST